MAKQLDAIDLVLKPSIRCSKGRDFLIKACAVAVPEEFLLGQILKSSLG